MDKVIIPSKFLIDLEIQVYKGHWENGEWVESTGEKKIIKGALFPFKPNDFKNYPEGLLKKDDKKLITKETLKDMTELTYKNQKYIVLSLQEYTDYLADTNFYIFRKVLNE